MKKIINILIIFIFYNSNQAQVEIAPFLRFNQPIYFKDKSFPKVYSIPYNFGGSAGIVSSYKKCILRASYDAQTQKYKQEMDSPLLYTQKGTDQKYMFSRQQVQLSLGYAIRQTENWKLSLELGMARTATVLETIKIYTQEQEIAKHKYYNYNPWRWKGWAYQAGVHVQKKVNQYFAVQISALWQQQLSGDYSYKKELNYPVTNDEGLKWIRPYNYPNNINNYFVSLNLGVQCNIAPLFGKAK